MQKLHRVVWENLGVVARNQVQTRMRRHAWSSIGDQIERPVVSIVSVQVSDRVYDQVNVKFPVRRT